MSKSLNDLLNEYEKQDSDLIEGVEVKAHDEESGCKKCWDAYINICSCNFLEGKGTDEGLECCTYGCCLGCMNM